MRYLKTYRLFESKDEVLNTIEDMLFELSDDGYLIRKSVKLKDDFYSWTTNTYSENLFEDPDTGEKFHFDGAFDQLHINIMKDLSKFKSLKKDLKDLANKLGMSTDLEKLQTALDRKHDNFDGTPFEEFLFNYKAVLYRKAIKGNYQNLNDIVELSKIQPYSTLTEANVYYKIPNKFLPGLGIELSNETEEAYIEEIHIDTKKILVMTYDRKDDGDMELNQYAKSIDIDSLSNEMKSFVIEKLKMSITKEIDKYKKFYEAALPLTGHTTIDVDSIKDFLLQLSDYSKSQGYDITLHFGNTSTPFTEEILQPGVNQLGYTYEDIKRRGIEYIAIVIHKNTVYEKVII